MYQKKPPIRARSRTNFSSFVSLSVQLLLVAGLNSPTLGTVVGIGGVGTPVASRSRSRSRLPHAFLTSARIDNTPLKNSSPPEKRITQSLTAFHLADTPPPCLPTKLHILCTSFTIPTHRGCVSNVLLLKEHGVVVERRHKGNEYRSRHLFVSYDACQRDEHQDNRPQRLLEVEHVTNKNSSSHGLQREEIEI